VFRFLAWLAFFTFLGLVLTAWMVVLGFFFGAGAEVGRVWVAHAMGHL
jgi:hypothetical protein